MTIQGCDGVALHVNEFLNEQPKALVVIIHGMVEHRKRYSEVAQFLNEQGYTVITYDQRGHGESLLESEEIGYLGTNGFEKMVKDAHSVIVHYQKRLPDLKTFILGHSMGSFVTQRYIQTYSNVDGVILMGSSYKTFGTRFLRTLGAFSLMFKRGKKTGKLFNQLIFGTYNNQFKPTRTGMDWLNSQSDEVDIYLNDPLCGIIPTNQFYYDFLSGLVVLQKERNIAKVKPNLPMFIIAGLKDPVGGNGKKVKELYRVYRKYQTNVKLKLYPEMRHELIVEKNKYDVFNDIHDWLEIQ